MSQLLEMIGEIALILMVIFTSIMMVRLHQDMRELKYMLQSILHENQVSPDKD